MAKNKIGGGERGGCGPGGCGPRGCGPGRGVVPGGRLVPGGCLVPGGLPQCMLGYPPCGQTDACKLITLPQTSFAGGNKGNYLVVPQTNGWVRKARLRLKVS